MLDNGDGTYLKNYGFPDKNADFRNRRTDTVLFDFDGTLFDTDPAIIASFRYSLGEFGVKEVSERKLRADFGGLLSDVMAKYRREFAIDADLDDMIKCYRDYHRSIFEEKITCYDGVPELLENLATSGYTLAVLTSRKRHTTEIGLKKYGFGKYFTAVQTSDDCPYAKPDRRAAETLLSALGKEPSSAVIIGDSAYDIGCGKNLGIPAVFAAWGRTPPEGAYGADKVARTPQEFFEYLNEK